MSSTCENELEIMDFPQARFSWYGVVRFLGIMYLGQLSIVISGFDPSAYSRVGLACNEEAMGLSN